MKHTLNFLVILACALFISIAAFGQEPAVLKWEQPPDMAGYDWSSETAVPSAVADDWICENGMPINQITWWGSYYQPAIYPYKTSDSWPDPTIPNNTPPETVTGFIINIFSDAGAGGAYSWSHPADLVYSAIVDATEILYGIATKPGGLHENVWEYTTILTDPFEQVQGNTYWLSIIALDNIVSTKPTIQWGWHQTDKLLYGFGDDAVQAGFSQNPEIVWDLRVDTEMAFRLYTVPEPSMMMILVSSLGLLGIMARKRSK